uniref:Uncharacterized protein n=1 Tax=Cannabis sativa TaxID=3483 RepID=A0A803R363_CANSA
MGACHFSLQDEVMITQRNGDIGAYIPQETNYIEERKIWALVPLRKICGNGIMIWYRGPSFTCRECCSSRWENLKELVPKKKK